MLASVDPFLSRRRRPGYDCRHFLREAWLAHTGEDLVARCPALLATDQAVSLECIRGAVRIAKPVDPCVVLMRTSSENHVGMFLRGNVLHLARAMPRFERLDIAAMEFAEVRFYQ